MVKKPAQSLKLTRFGNPVLRGVAPSMQLKQIKTAEIQKLIFDMRKLLESKQFGVGLAAPQVGKDLRIAVICIRPTKTRLDVAPYDQVIINPRYEGVGRRQSTWEGCLSSGAGKNTLHAKALRWKIIKASWLDETGKRHEQTLDGLKAHVFQHETDHLDGVLFVDKVRDTKTFMLSDEYRKRIIHK